MKKFIGLLLVLCLFNFLSGLGGGADQVNWPDIYIDESVAPGGVGSEADPYSDFSEINWTTGGDNSVFDYYNNTPAASVTINLQKGEEWRELLTIGASGSATYPIIVQAYGDGAAPILNGSDLVSTWTESGGSGTFYCAESADDARTEDVGEAIDTSGSAVVFGDYQDGIYNGGFRFINVTVPKDATISSATVTGTAGESRSETTINIQIEGEQNATPAVFSTWGDFSGRTPTSATVAWNNIPSWSANSTYASPSITTIISEITSLAGWSSGNNLVIFYQDNSSDTDARRDYKSYDGVGADIKLDVSYGTANVWQATCTTEPEKVFFDDTEGTEDATPDAEFDWYWDADVLYCYSETDPDTAYQSPGVEAPKRNNSVVNTSFNYFTLDGLLIEKSNSHGISLYYNNANAGNTIQNCTMQHTCGAGIYCAYGSGWTLDNLTIHDTANNGIAMWGSAANAISNTVVKNCTVYDVTGNDGFTFHASNGDDCGDGHLLQDNTFYDCAEEGMDLISGTGIIAENNTTHDNGTGAFLIGDAAEVIVRYHTSYNDSSGTGGAYHIQDATGSVEIYYCLGYGTSYHQVVIAGAPTDGVEIYNCVFIQAGGSPFDLDDAGMENITVKNNIIYNSVGYEAMRFQGDDPDYATFDFDNNQFLATGDDAKFYDGAAWKTLAEHISAYSQETNSQEGNPLFVDFSGDDFRLLMGSPCINAGTDVGLTTDYRGRSIRHAPDIGAYEDPTSALFLTKLFEYLKEKK